VYTKTHPVPFGEHIPWRSVIGGWSSRFDRIPRDMLPGQGEGPLSVYGLLVADAICFDVAYDDVLPGQVARGGQIAVVQTSNATFTGTTQPEQQFEITRARAVELGRTVVVASTNGVSGVIAGDGEVTQRATGEEAATLVAEVELADRVTPAVRSQSVRSATIPAVAVVGLLLAFARGLRRRGRGRVSTRFERSVELPKAAEVGVVVGHHLTSGAGLGAVEPTSLAPVGGDPSDDEGSGEDRERVVTQRPSQ
jgi:apolipoprotein N-acyltransferase